MNIDEQSKQALQNLARRNPVFAQINDLLTFREINSSEWRKRMYNWAESAPMEDVEFFAKILDRIMGVL